MTTPENDERAARLRQAIRLKKATARSRVPDLSPRPADQPAHLGDMQRSLWLVHQMEPRSPAYNLTSAFRVRGPLDFEKLQRAFNTVVSRHRLLRSAFRFDRNDVDQIVQVFEPLEVKVLAVEDEEGRAAAIQEARRPFDLETGPLTRMRVIEETSKSERLLLLVLHHILADERSLGLLWREIAAAYEGRLDDTPPSIQYDDYLHWLRQRDPKERQLELDTWRRRLDPLPDELRLPFEKPGASESGDPKGRLLSRTSSRIVPSSIRRLAAATGVTPFMVYAFAYRLLLHRYTQGQHVAFATPASTRSHPATADMIGYFLNPVVISGFVDEEQRVEHALREFSRELKEDLSHASVPFQTLAEALAPPRRRDRHPLFQTMFVYQQSHPPPRLGEARLEPLMLDLGASKFDLTLFVTEGEGSVAIAVEYRTDRYDAIWMDNLLVHYETLLAHLPEDGERTTAELPMLEAEEQNRLLAYAQGAEAQTTETALLSQQILDRARRSPESPAVTCGGAGRSYGELERSARSIAHELTAHGVKPGDRVGVFVDRSTQMLEALIGSHWAGAAYVPLDPGYPPSRNRDILEDADVTAVLTTSTLQSRLPAGNWAAIALDVLDPLTGNGTTPTELPELQAESPAYILYTSGSTGRPKGVVVTHGNLSASTGARFTFYDTPPGRFLLVPSIAFDSSVAGLFWTLATGGTLVIPTDEEARDAGRLARLVAEQHVTCLLLVPSLYAQMIGAGDDLLKGLETAIVAGESCPSQLVGEHFRSLPHVRLFNEYGPTEATVWASVHEATEDDATQPVAVGRPIPGVRIDVVDALGRPVPAGIPGQAWITGATVAQGYWRRPDLTEECFVMDAERRYRTGDRMAWTAEGRLLFLGREDEQIKLRGFRIEPGEIEAALLESPAIERAAVVARSIGPGGATLDASQLVAFVQTPDSEPIENWRQTLARRLPDYMVPSRLVTLAELPLLPNGKVNRRHLQDLVLDPEVRGGEPARIPSTREQALISLWEGLLGRTGIGPNDNFFELGGHSLLVVEMTRAIERDFEASLRVTDVFEHPTVEELARHIEKRGGSEAPPYQHLFPIQPAGRKMPFIVAVPHFFTQMFAARFRGERPVYGLRGVSLRPEGNRGLWRTMTDLGEEMVEEIVRRFPDQRCIMAGYSFGASMAIEAVRVMEERGVPVQRLYLIAPMAVDFYRFGSFRVQIDGLRKPVDQLSTSEAISLFLRCNNPLTRRPYSRAWRRLGIESWRRMLCGVGKLRRWIGLPLTPRILHADVRVERFRLHGQYRPGIVHTPTVIFNAEDTETDAAATWRPYFEGPFTVHPTPDPHDATSVEAARKVILRHLDDLGDS